jgi:adenine/guanine phosphoribosyltransferase-like PRPP-binding protein
MLTLQQVDAILQVHPNEPLDMLRLLGGYYKCPIDAQGKRLGPLVGYAGRYDGAHQWVGEEYVNFAMAETYPIVLRHFAYKLSVQLRALLTAGNEVFCGAPLGGLAFAAILALINRRPYVFPEKKIIALATESSREQSKLVFARHGIFSGCRYFITDDVVNNFSTTQALIDLIKNSGGEVAAIVCFLNRSLTVGDNFNGIPVISLVSQPIAEFKQDDPLVAADIAGGNVVWKPKDEWDRLAAAMERETAKELTKIEGE